MNDRIKKLSSWSMPIVIIAGLLYLSVSFINGDEIKFGPVKPFLASISNSVSLFFEKIGGVAPNSQTAEETTPTDSNISTPTSTVQNNETSSSLEILAESSYALTPAQAPPTQKNGTSTVFTGNIERKTYSAGESTTTSRGIVSSGDFPDLSIQIVDMGILNSEDVFAHATSVQQGQKGAVVFDVKNIGGKASSEWIFSGQIPTPIGNFTSEEQIGLAPEEGIRFTMGFSNLINSGVNNVSF